MSISFDRTLRHVALALLVLLLPGLLLATDEPCRTQQHYVANYLARYKAMPATEVCQLGPCDYAANRNPFIPESTSEIYTIRLFIHVFAEDDGSNAAATAQEITGLVETLNTDFELHRIQFSFGMQVIESSTFRYLDSANEFGTMKNLWATNPASQLNIYITGYEGAIATFPWDENWNQKQGGIVIDEMHVSSDQHWITHEVGHCLGLWHVFHGASDEIDPPTPCSGCREWAPIEGNSNDVTGDLCADTRPTPKRISFPCSELGVQETDECSQWGWAPTPWQNYMSYGWDCMDNFTPHQAGRMRCWSANVLYSWFETSPIPLSPADNGCVSVLTAITFDWEDVANAQTYNIEIATDTSFTSIAASANGLNASTWTTPPSGLSQGTYYWRSLAVINGNTGPWSAVQTLKVICCIGTTGNVNKSANETPDLTDLSLLMSYLYSTPRPTLPCAGEANINAIGSVDLSDLSLLIAYFQTTPRPTLPNCPCQ